MPELLPKLRTSARTREQAATLRWRERVCEALAQVPAEARDDVQVLLTAHSMPKRVIDTEPDYIKDFVRQIEVAQG